MVDACHAVSASAPGDTVALRFPNNGYELGSCAGCGATDGLRVCAGCRVRKYCGKKCQKTDWARHKTDCWEGIEVAL